MSELTKAQELIESGRNPEGLYHTVTLILQQDPESLSVLAEELAKDKPAETLNNQLAILRVTMSRACEELNLPRLTINKTKRGYIVTQPKPREDPRRKARAHRLISEAAALYVGYPAEEKEALVVELRTKLNIPEPR